MIVVHAASSPMTLRLFVDDSGRRLAKAGVRFLYLFGNERGSPQLRGATLRVTLPRGYLFFLAWLSSGATLKKVLAVSPDVVHVHTPATALGLVWVLRGLKRKNVRLVYTARGGFDEGRRWVTRALWHVVDPVRWGLWNALGVVNHHLLESTQKTSQVADVSLLSLGGASLNISATSPLGRPKVRVSQPPTIRIAWVGRYSRDKRPADFSALVTILRDENGLSVEGIMMGDGNGTDRARVSGTLSDGIERLGWVDCPQIFLADCDLLISTSVREGYGLVPVESAMVGTPTIAYTTFGTSKSLPEVGGRLVPARDLRALAHAVLEWVALSDSAKAAWRADVERKSKALVSSVDVMDEMACLYGHRL